MEGFALRRRRLGYGFGEGVEDFEHAGCAVHLAVGINRHVRVGRQAGMGSGRHLGSQLHHGVDTGGLEGVAGGDLFPLGGLAGQEERFFGSSHVLGRVSMMVANSPHARSRVARR